MYVKPLEESDVLAICGHRFPGLPSESISAMTRSLERLRHEVEDARSIGIAGAPWQLNLRDLLRWCEAAERRPELARRLGKLLLAERFRSPADREAAGDLLKTSDDASADSESTCCWNATEGHLQIGSVSSERWSGAEGDSEEEYLLLREQLPQLESLQLCVTHRWIPILVGDSGDGFCNGSKLMRTQQF